MSAPLTIIYITGRGYSGSTLLDLLTSSHPDVTSVGEIKSLSARKKSSGRRPVEEPCTCGAPRLPECPFWAEVEKRTRASSGLGLEDIDVYRDDPAGFRAHNLAVLEAVREVSGCRFIVDSSKDLRRLRRLLDTDGFDVRPIHLVRSPYGVLHSHAKRGHDLTYQAGKYTRTIMRVRRTLSARDHLTIRYEELASSPRAVLRRVMEWIGLAFTEEQLDWPAYEHHNLTGNPMRFSRNREIRQDVSWKTGLSLRQKIRIGRMTFPTRLPGTWLYDLWPSLWTGRRRGLLR